MRSIALLTLLTALVAACTTTTNSTRPNPTQNPPAASGGSPDRVTASDETEGARRARVRLELASAYYSRGQMEVALDQVKLAIAADPNLAEAFSLRGLIYANLGDDRLAEESFARALQLNPRDGDTMHNLGWYHCQRKRYAEAVVQFDRAIAQPGYAGGTRTLFTKGVCLAFDKQYVEAEKSLARAWQFEPSNPAIGTNLAEVLYLLGRYDRAQATIQRVNGLPGVANAQTLWLAARIERRLGNVQAVAQIGTRLRRDFPNSPETEAFEQGRFE
jgi:type IV pilus assembly protein PilF